MPNPNGDKLAMFHRRCGRVAIYVKPEVVDNPKRKFMADDVETFDGRPVKAGQVIWCQCGAPVQFHPRYLDFERHPNEYLCEKVTVAIAPMCR